MKKINLFIAPTMAVSLLANCGGNNPQPEPVIPTYTVILNAGDGASFKNNKQYISLYNVPENTILNQIDGYALPTTPDHLDFNHWIDAEGNVVLDDAPVTSDLFLTSSFYWGPEFRRKSIKTYIYDDLWNILNVPNWNSPFSSEPDKNKILQSFSEMTTSVVMNNKLTTIASLDAMKEFYLVLKDYLFKWRHEEVTFLEKALGVCKNHLDKMLDALNGLTNPVLEEAIVNLSIAYFEVKDYPTITNGILDYAYQTLLTKIKELSSDNINRIKAWSVMVRGLMIAAYYKETEGGFDNLLEIADTQIEEILKNSKYTTLDVVTLAKVYADYNVADLRAADQAEKDLHKEHLDFIKGHYVTLDTLEKYIVDLYKSFFSSYASEIYSAGTSSKIADIESMFNDRISNVGQYIDSAASYLSIAMSFAEGIRKNPSEVLHIKDIVGSFFDKITSDDPTLQEYRCYIKPFASFAKATSLIDFNHETFDKRPISFNQYKANATWIIEKIDACSYKDDPNWYEAMNILSEYVAKYSDYGNYAIDGDAVGIFRDVILKEGEYKNLPPIAGACRLPFDNDIVIKAFRQDIEISSYFDKTRCIELLNWATEYFWSYNWSIFTLNQCRWFYEKILLKLYCSYKSSGTSLQEMFDVFINAVKLVNDRIRLELKTYLLGFLLPIIRLSDNENVFRGLADNDISRSFDSFIFVINQMMKFCDDMYSLDIVQYNDCIANVIINDYIPNITEDITQESRQILEGEVESKIYNLLEEHRKI
ncbi:MAG: hypothetical protein MJ214_05105 [Bacilli bacterium]|nr:hypothetical protein [Bacilli bacterium]